MLEDCVEIAAQLFECGERPLPTSDPATILVRANVKKHFSLRY